MDPDLDALKIDVHTLKADQKHTEANLARVDGLGEKLRLEVELLQRDKSQLLGIIKMLAGFGVLGAGFVLYIWAQLAGLNNQIGVAKGQADAINAVVRDSRTQLENDFNKYKAALQSVASEERKKSTEYVKQKIPDLLPEVNRKITFLDRSQILPIVEHFGDYSPTGYQDMRVINMTASGIEQDCKGIVPDNARGAILMVRIVRMGGDGSAQFAVTDSQGSFPPAYSAVFNDSSKWVGGVVFCPFHDGQKFNWVLRSSDSDADSHIGCFGWIIGWF
jgi:hypothetical protein